MFKEKVLHKKPRLHSAFASVLAGDLEMGVKMKQEFLPRGYH